MRTYRKWLTISLTLGLGGIVLALLLVGTGRAAMLSERGASVDASEGADIALAGDQLAGSISGGQGAAASVDLWAACGNGALDPGETLVSCPTDAQVAQRS